MFLGTECRQADDELLRDLEAMDDELFDEGGFIDGLINEDAYS